MENKLPNLEEEWHKQFLGEQSGRVDNAEFAYWSAALTFNTVIISVFTVALSLSSNKYLTILLVFLSLISAILLVMNFYSRIKSHRNIMRSYYRTPKI
jgi:hypothetical protein